MEPRARAGKNVGKMNFGFGELRQLLYGSGDAREPLPETMRLLDEIATDFIQSLAFEAARIGHYSGRQKIKYEDFEFALRRNPLFLGKVREMFEMSKEVKDARKMPGIGEGNLAKADINDLAKLGEEEAQDKTDKGDGSHVAGNSKKRAKGDGAASKKKKAKTAATNKAADEARVASNARNNAGNNARYAGNNAGSNAGKTASTSAEPAESADIAAKEEPDLEEPSGLDALFGDDDDDDVDFGDEPGNGNKDSGQADGTTVKSEDDLDGLDADLAAELK